MRMKTLLPGLLFFWLTASVCAASVEEGMADFEKQDYEQTLRILRPLAEQGNADAQHRIAVMHRHGLGVPPGDAEALYWYVTAARQGHILAQNSAAVMYQFGMGTAVDPAEAAHQ